jgi:hypothetical protein
MLVCSATGTTVSVSMIAIAANQRGRAESG